MNHRTTAEPVQRTVTPPSADAELVAKVAEAIRTEIGKRHAGLPRGGWNGLMRNAAIAAIKTMETENGLLD